MPSGVEEVRVSKGGDVYSKPESKETMNGKGSSDGQPKSTMTSSEGNQKPSEVQANEESVEVVLGESGTSTIVESPPKTRPPPDQSIFRHPHSMPQAVRPRAMRAPPGPVPPHHPPPPHHHHAHHHPPPPHHPAYLHGSGSWGYGPPPPHPHADYPPPPPPHPSRPYPVPPYNSSGSFDDQGSYHHHTPHYSPHIQYPPPSRHPSESVNVISPNQKGDPHYRPPLTPRPRHLPPPQPYYQYPPASPVSRPLPPAAPQSSAPPRLRNYAMRRGETAYARSQRGEQQYHPDDGTWNPYVPPPPSTTSGDPSRSQPPVVAESFDSDHKVASHPPTPGGDVPPVAPTSHDPHYQFYGGGGSWGSFDSAAPPPPPQFDDQRYYAFPPDSPYSPYAQPYSPGGIYHTESFPPPVGYPHHGPPPSFSYSYDDEERLLKDYHPDRDGEDHRQVTPPGNSKLRGRSKNSTPISSNTSSRNLVLPKAAEEIDFDVTDPPLEPVLPPSNDPVCESLADVNTYDVLCGRGGGTNSQVGNRKFRKLVQEFQPTYLMAKRKEKPLLARTIVLIIRKRGGRFLKKNEDTGELFEVGDAKAEAKTSQALREGLDVRATKSAASSLVDKKKKKKSPKSPGSEEDSPRSAHSPSSDKSPISRPVESPPTLPKLQDDGKAGVHPLTPTPGEARKRRRMRSTDRYFPDFCPPRAELNRTGSPSPDDEEEEEDDVLEVATTPVRRNHARNDDYDHENVHPRGCAGIALDMVTGAAAGSFCLGPTGWRR